MVRNRGTATGDLLWVLAVIAALWVLWLATGGSLRPSATSGPFIKPPPPLGTGEIYSTDGHTARVGSSGTTRQMAEREKVEQLNRNSSPWFGQIKIRAGNARSEESSNREYIELVADRKLLAPVNITGWQLVNNPARRARADVVLIPAAAKVFSSAAAAATLAPIVLAAGEKAMITTGSPPNSSRWPARASFQVNRCVGYLTEQAINFRLASTLLPRACPAPREELGAIRLNSDCYDYVRRLSSCHKPEFKRKSDGHIYLDDRINKLSSACRAYLEDHFSYDRCLAWHQTDPDFYVGEWRVFLNHTWELWAKDREVISIYDAQGRLVDESSY